MIDAAGDFIAELGTSRDADEVFEALLTFSMGLGFDCALAGELRVLAPDRPPVLLDCRVRSHTDEFEDYVSRRLFQHDPLFVDFLGASRPFVNRPEELRAARTTSEQSALLSYSVSPPRRG
jgi:hypothetical protein